MSASGTQSSLAASRARARAGGWPWLTVRWLGALAVLAVGAVHLQQYDKLYSGVPTIGTLFVLTFAGATAIGLALLAPIERLAGRFGRLALALATIGGIGLAGMSFVLLFISERTPLFGFQEPGYDPTAITASRVLEIAAVVLLGAFLIARFAARAGTRRW
jgi:hypothetical protein